MSVPKRKTEWDKFEDGFFSIIEGALFITTIMAISITLFITFK